MYPEFYKFHEIKMSNLSLVACKEPVIKLTQICKILICTFIINNSKCFPVIEIWKLIRIRLYV